MPQSGVQKTDVVEMVFTMGSKDKSPLLYFYGVDCTHCDLMDPLMKQLEEETGMTLRKFEVWYNDDNLRLLQRLDKHGVCNGVPFFYSKQKRDWICGATTYHNFKAWAVGKPHERFLAPPTEDETMNKFKSTFDNIKNNGFDFSFLKTLQDRLEDGRRRAGSAPDAAKEGTGGNSAFAFYGGVLTPKARPGVCSKRPKRG